MIAAESIRAFWCEGSRGIIGTVEWICTTGGQNARAFHYARSLLWQRREADLPLRMLIRPIDDFSIDPDLNITLTIGPPEGHLFCALRRLPGRNDPPWQLATPLATIPVVHDEHLSSCRMKITRGSDYVSQHFCDINEMRRFQGGTHQHSDGYVPTVTRERYERQ